MHLIFKANCISWCLFTVYYSSSIQALSPFCYNTCNQAACAQKEGLSTFFNKTLECTILLIFAHVGWGLWSTEMDMRWNFVTWIMRVCILKAAEQLMHPRVAGSINDNRMSVSISLLFHHCCVRASVLRHEAYFSTDGWKTALVNESTWRGCLLIWPILPFLWISDAGLFVSFFFYVKYHWCVTERLTKRDLSVCERLQNW